MPIYLIGMMGSGKTTIGKILSDILNKKYIDIDEKIEKNENMKIKEIFSQKGEEYFREMESRILEKTENEDAIISTGGGIILKEKNRKILKKHKTLFLYVPMEELIKRVEVKNRPLLKEGKEKLYEIWDKRKELYEEFEKINLSNLNPYESAAKLLYSILESAQEKIDNDFQNVVLKIKGLNDLKDKNNVFVNKDVYRIYNDKFNNVYILENGEKIKKIDNVKKIYKYLIKNNVGRNDTIYAVGGGTVTDLIGYIGATFKRGIKFQFYPTTLLSQVDASIGGKNAINFEGIKNVIGTFKVPNNVIIDPLTVISQKEENYLEGIIEAFKIAIINGNVSLFLNNIEKIKKRNLNLITDIIKYAVKVKLDIVTKDPFDNDIRKLLNLGHTLGHAFESYTGISHGLSVGWGIKKEIEFFSKEIKLKDKNIIFEFLEQIMPDDVLNKKININNLLEYIFQDKKIINKNKIDIPIIKNIGNVELKSIGLFLQ
ncbi:shikimate kinase [Marinitoga aeolica]|uniref:Shikimate kinase n=1 Tax=Marinitoga aeolica TaxID=2809031 RepID=A0ABY8PP45_9BACT|nr:shikimate kinase [Marinitoga aeolica]WGS64416.1 AAA family ATPase [Marinitoga aeolica]